MDATQDKALNDTITMVKYGSKRPIVDLIYPSGDEIYASDYRVTF